MVKKTIKNNAGTLYNLYDEISRTKEQSKLIVNELRRNNCNVMLYPRISWYKEISYYIYYKNKRKTIIPETFNNRGKIYTLLDKEFRTKEQAKEKNKEIRISGMCALYRIFLHENQEINYVIFVAEKTSNKGGFRWL